MPVKMPLFMCGENILAPLVSCESPGLYGSCPIHPSVPTGELGHSIDLRSVLDLNLDPVLHFYYQVGCTHLVFDASV